MPYLVTHHRFHGIVMKSTEATWAAAVSALADFIKTGCPGAVANSFLHMLAERAEQGAHPVAMHDADNEFGIHEIAEETTSVEHAGRAHSELGASICERWWNCPGSVRAVRSFPNRSTPAARQGTAEHETAELCLKNGQAAIEYVGRTVAGVEIDEDAAERVQQYLDECLNDEAEDGPAWSEVAFDLASFGPPAPMYGTADWVKYIQARRLLRIRDYKSGFIRVKPTSFQLKYYALGAVVALGTEHPVTEVECVIVQPRQGGVKSHTYTAVELAEWSAELIERAKATQDPDAPLHAGSWCRYCPAAGSCAEQARYSLELAQGEFAQPPSSEVVAAVELPPPDTLPLDVIGRILDRASEIRSWLASAEEVAKAAAMDGQDVPGWKLTDAFGRYRWSGEPQTAADTLGFVHGLKMYDDPPVISAARARDQLTAKLWGDALAAWETAGKPKGKKPTKKAAEEIARAEMRPFAHVPVTGLTLVPVADARSGVSGAAEFAALPDETQPAQPV